MPLMALGQALVNGKPSCGGAHYSFGQDYICGSNFGQIQSHAGGTIPDSATFTLNRTNGAQETVTTTTKITEVPYPEQNAVVCIPKTECDTSVSNSNAVIREKITTLEQQIQQNNAVISSLSERRLALQIQLQAVQNSGGVSSGLQEASLKDDIDKLSTAIKTAEKHNKNMQAEITDWKELLGDGYSDGTPRVFTPEIPSYPEQEVHEDQWFDGYGLDGGGNRIERQLDRDLARTKSLPELVTGWLRFAFPLVALIAVVAIVYAGFLFIFYYGDDTRRETAQKIIMYVVVGIVLVFAAYAIVNTLITGIQ